MYTVEIRWHGRGGQGIVTANEILAAAALREGMYMKAFPEFGPERMGSPIVAFARISDAPINVHSQVYYPDYVVVVDPTLLHLPNILEGLKQTGTIIANYPDGSANLKQVLGQKYDAHAVNATKISTEELGRPMTNTAMLGALVKVSKIVSLESVTAELRVKFQGKFSAEVTEKNVSAVERAYQEVE
jgi:pyruvate ferredoxin oxidoreductase gamma subunit